jgi:hypothetical protein
VSEWEVVRHAVAISGQVTDAQTGKGLGGARVTITDAPETFTSRLAAMARHYGERWERMAERPDKKQAVADGHFHFMDLPNGDYVLAAELPGSGSRYGTAQVEAEVTRDGEGRITMAVTDIALPPTTIKGEITDQDSEKVVMAEVRVQGSGERVFTNSQGGYLLVGVEKGERTVSVSAQGYQPASRKVTLGQAGAVQTLNIVLEK